MPRGAHRAVMEPQLRQYLTAREAVILDEEIVFPVIRPAGGGLGLRHRRASPKGAIKIRLPSRGMQSSEAAAPAEAPNGRAAALPAFPPPPFRVIAAQASSRGRRKFSDEHPKPDAGRLVVLITKRV